jgi:hypothetical protein
MLDLGLIAFANPWLLLGLASLPILWLLLRVTPPAPRRQIFPAIRLLAGLKAREETPIRTPWWLVLLRSVAIALVILGLARPVLNPDERLYGSGPLILVLDDSWAAARGWSRRIAAAEHLLDQAAREGRMAAIVTTAPQTSVAQASVLLPASEARRSLGGLEPKPWPVDRLAALERIEALDFSGSAHVVWLSDGQLGSAEPRELVTFAERLQKLGRIDLLDDGAGASGRLILPPEIRGASLALRVERAGTQAPESLRVLGIGTDGGTLSVTDLTFEAAESLAEGELKLPSELRNRIARFKIAEEEGAGAVMLMDESWRRRPVGVVSAARTTQAQPLLAGAYYLERALGPFAELRAGTLEELLERELAILTMTDDAPLQDLQLLENWIQAGGLLIRFAGPRLAEKPEGPLPIVLRGRDRVLGGALTWNAPVALAAFPANSPFHGLEVPRDVVVRRQVLAEPSLELAQKSWATLSDGTPLVTGERVGEGWVVLFHVSANTEWSNLPLSGLFVEMLRRLMEISHGISTRDAGELLQPISVLDGFGTLESAKVSVKPADAGTLDAPGSIGPWHPPGFYGGGGLRHAHNLGGDLAGLAPLPTMPAGTVERSYADSREFDIGPWLIALAMVLLLADLLLSLFLRGHLPHRQGSPSPAGRLAGAGVAILICLLLTPAVANAQSQFDEERALEATLLTRLGYVLSDVPETDATSAAGLSGLTRVLHLRTSIEAGPPLPVDIERDELSFFPLLYWPILPDGREISPVAVKKLQDYLDKGGTVLFDLRDPSASARIASRTSRAEQSLRHLLKDVDIPPLVPISPDHVLTKAFYLLQDFPGRYSGGTLWVEGGEGSDRDGVTSVVIGANDWASAWAVDRLARPLYPVVPGGERQRELAYRFGVNLVMYALTGNYKADQVHVPFILERLGQ